MTFFRPLAQAITVALLTASAGQALAQAAAPAAAASATASSPAKKELVAKVMKLQQGGFENIGSALLGEPAQLLLQGAGRALGQVPADKREALGKDIQAEVKKFFDTNAPYMRERAVKLAATTIGPLLEEKFSEDELKTLVAWLESPVSRKFSEIVPQSQQLLGQKVVEDTRSTIEPKLKALEQSVAKKLGLPAQGAQGGAPAGGGVKPPAAAASGKK
ncbi:DUF2059 domain-containing protein [Aquabacterium sp. OR-4]|uniref:DUF2059 domain-containing protein n=1 Tax=Aquabacterium sp. OR-4 TaxID=2978127 RepID=UPI0021B466E6|nr:DUF2059 domain-containing protein [Aquabacterium sp. OR-4]MDT7836830.1 DUF2059 domain-containing protein [Aquabacterium sp. OR-4]